MASGVYNEYKEDLLTALCDMTADSFKVALMNNSHAFTAANASYAGVSTNEMTGTGYSAGGAALGTLSVSVASSVGKWDAGDLTWTSSTFTAYHAVIYNTSNASSLVCSIDFGGAQTVSGGNFTIQWNSAGIVTLT